jgi:hypothetical protein
MHTHGKVAGTNGRQIMTKRKSLRSHLFATFAQYRH